MTELFAEVPAERGVARGLWTRRVVMAVFALVALLALWGLFGQRAQEVTAQGNGVTMTVSAPEAVRGGLYFQSTIDITTTQAIDLPRLVFADGWVEGMQVNSIEPAAESETSRDGTLVLSYGAIEPGDRLKVWFQFQVDPTEPGRRSYKVELDDGTTALVTVDRDLMVLP
jgi:hypothetical protein